MAKFVLQPNERRCKLCGRLGSVVGILYSNKPEAARPRMNERIDICGRCGQLIYQITTKEECDKDRTRRYEKDLPK